MELIHTWFHFPEFRCVFALFCPAAECEDSSPRGIDRCENALLQAAASARIIHPVYCTNPRGCVGFFLPVINHLRFTHSRQQMTLHDALSVGWKV